MDIASTANATTQCEQRAQNKDQIKAFFLSQLSQFFKVTDYSLWKAILGKYANILCTYLWTFMNIFIIIIGVGLANRFAIFNNDLKRIRGQNMPEQFWAMRRAQYRRLCNLVLFIDEHISHIIFVSVANNLFFVCTQLLRTMR